MANDYFPTKIAIFQSSNPFPFFQRFFEDKDGVMSDSHLMLEADYHHLLLTFTISPITKIKDISSSFNFLGWHCSHVLILVMVMKWAVFNRSSLGPGSFWFRSSPSGQVASHANDAEPG
jgi:hypothetical protein